MPNILDEIVAAKTTELALQKAKVDQRELETRISIQSPPLNLSGALMSGGVRLIAEIKKASPSRGLLCPDFDPVLLAQTYADNGAAAISVLTDPRFQGEPDHIAQIKSSGASQRAPVLRKDFIFDPYQVYEARAVGADAILLIVAILEPGQLKELLALRLANMHNLRFILRLMQEMRDAIINDRFDAFQRGFWDAYRPTDEAARQEQKGKWLRARGG